MHRTGMIIAAALLVLTGLVFGLDPQLDLIVARMFLADGKFIGITPLGEFLRSIGHGLPYAVMGLAILTYLLRQTGMVRLPALPGRAVIFMALAFLLGPGLLVNVILKDNSHRPRPVQTQELGGPWEFRPWYRFDGKCVKNCSFVSGEASSAFWMLAPALLAPAPLKPAAITAALVFGTSVAVLRMAFGGHYMSDSIISALLTILLVLGLHRLILRRGSEKADPDLRKPRAPL